MWLDDCRTALYRLYSEAGTLLYIGISHQPEVRFEQHSKLKDWWPRVARREVEWFDDRPTAARAEAEAIRAEDPEHNGTYSPRVNRRTIRDVLANDGVREVSLSLARPRLTTIVGEVAHADQPVALLNHGRRYAMVVSMDFYERALAAMGEERVLVEKPAAG
ncbi:GIY-YIG nuclease family protein [Streptomyces sp. NPDC049744]|uniref:GIY-YIG nuclease family protein n=1 Tax=Streptomyces sp. NPDC049744 TaxID=3154359 RepID=UPI003431A05E